MRFILLNIVRLLFLLFVVAAIRGVIGYAAKAFRRMGSNQSPSSPASASPSATPGGELKKDPVCGTFVSTAASVQKSFNGQVVHFCSAGCRDQYRA